MYYSIGHNFRRRRSKKQAEKKRSNRKSKQQESGGSSSNEIKIPDELRTNLILTRSKLPDSDGSNEAEIPNSLRTHPITVAAEQSRAAVPPNSSIVSQPQSAAPSSNVEVRKYLHFRKYVWSSSWNFLWDLNFWQKIHSNNPNIQYQFKPRINLIS